MIDELPDLGDIFSSSTEKTSTSSKNKVNSNDDIVNEDIELNKDIYIYISKDGEKWTSVTFIDIAPGGVGIHVLLPVEIEFNVVERDNVKLRFSKKDTTKTIVIKEIIVSIRWRDREPLSGKIKLGIHFSHEVYDDHMVINILRELKSEKKF